MSLSTSVPFSPASRTLGSSLSLACFAAAAFSFVPSASAGSAVVDLTPNLTSTGFAWLNFDFGSGGWSPEAVENAVDPNGSLVPVFDFSPQLLAILAAQRHTNALLVQLLFIAGGFAVASVALVTFKGLNHFLGYHGAAKKS